VYWILRPWERIEIQRSIQTPAHQTLIHQNGLPSAQYADVIRSYAPLRDQLIELDVKAIVADNSCVAFLRPAGLFWSAVQFYPKDKIPHIKMRLRKRV